MQMKLREDETDISMEGEILNSRNVYIVYHGYESSWTVYLSYKFRDLF